MRKNLRQQQLVTIPFFALLTQGVWAADNASEQDYLQEFPIVLSASRLSQPLSEAPNAMTVIDRKMIVASGFRSLPDVFKLVPGMYVSYYAGSQAVVSYHGALSQDAPGMQVLIDGRSVYLPPFNVVDWATLPITLDDIERIEVVRGPAAASYGENSVHGVINIITRDAGAVEGTTISNTRGNKGINDASARFGKHGETLDYRMTLAYTADNGYDNLATPPNNIPLPLAQGAGLLNNSNDNNQTRLMNYRASYHPNAVDDFEVQLGFNHDVMGVGFWDSTPDKPHDMISYSNTQQLEWLHRTDNTSELSLRYYHIQHDTNESYQLGTPSYPVSTSMKTGRNDIELQHTLQTSGTNRLVYGAGYRQDQVDGNSYDPVVAPSYFPTSFTLKEYRAFANDEWRFNQQLIVNAGGMLENDAMGNREFSPRASFNFHLTPQHTIRIGVSVAHRTPSLGEQYANGASQYQLGYKYEPGPSITSVGLTPEKIVSREIGYLGEFHELETSLDLRIFSDQVSNMIYPLPYTSLWGNGMTADYKGIEATIKHSFGKFSDLTFNCATEIVNSNSDSLSLGQLNPLSGSLPRNIVSMLYSQHLPNDASLSAAYYFQTSMLGFDRGPVDFQPTHRRVDMRLAQPFKGFGGLKGEVAGVVQNLFNTDYTEYIATALFNRRAFVTLTLHWQ
jgi:iron complex outermembrane receptor protein